MSVLVIEFVYTLLFVFSRRITLHVLRIKIFLKQKKKIKDLKI